MWRKSQNFFKEALLEPLPALIVPSPALITPLPEKPFNNASPSKQAPKVPNDILRNPPLCSLASCWIVLLTPFRCSRIFERFNYF